MKTYKELIEEEKEMAKLKVSTEFLKAICEIPELLPDELQPLAKKASEKCEKMQTPWFYHKYLLDIPEIKEWFDDQVLFEMEEAIYVERGESFYYGVCL
jgi:hypothetical protein